MSPARLGEEVIDPDPRLTTMDLGLHFFGVALKLQRSRIAIEDNR